MIKYNKIMLSLLYVAVVFSSNPMRIVTIGGCVTETVFKLGLEENVVAVDLSSTSPSRVRDLPQVGYIRAISSEGILSMSPSIILTTTDIGPPKVVEQIKDSGVVLEIFDSPHTYQDILTLILNISSLLNVENKGKIIVDDLNLIKDNIINIRTSYLYIPKIAFFMNPTSGSYTAAGSNTRADYLIKFIGGENIFSKDFDKYRKVSKEEIVKYSPDIILIGNTMKVEEDGNSKIFSNKEFKSIAAIKNEKLFTIDMSLLTFGPSFVSDALVLMNRMNIENK